MAITGTISTGVAGLDRLLGGGFLPGAGVLVEGAPGTGKTTLGLQFLCRGAAEGQAGLYVTFEQLPEQIYRDAANFGWDLRALERRGLLRVVATSPGVLLSELAQPSGWVEEVASELAVRRFVLDSLTLLESGVQARERVYALRSALRRLGVTALLLKEQGAEPGAWMGEPATADAGHGGIPSGSAAEASGAASAAAYVCDDWITLAYVPMAAAASAQQAYWRLRVLEVLKHRGAPFVSGPHLLRFGADGLDLVPPHTVPPHPVSLAAEPVSSGIPSLDRLLGGGLVRGASYVLDTNSKANYVSLRLAVIAEQLRRGGAVVALASADLPPNDLAPTFARLGVDLVAAARQGRYLLIDVYDRPVPEALEPYVVRVAGLDAAAFVEEGGRRVRDLVRSGPPRQWLYWYDMNALLAEHGSALIARYFAQLVAAVRARGDILLAVCNFAEISERLGAFLERTAAGVLRTWLNGRYQFLQVEKSPSGELSGPHVVVPSEVPPFVDVL